MVQALAPSSWTHSTSAATIGRWVCAIPECGHIRQQRSASTIGKAMISLQQENDLRVELKQTSKMDEVPR